MLAGSRAAFDIVGNLAEFHRVLNMKDLINKVWRVRFWQNPFTSGRNQHLYFSFLGNFPTAQKKVSLTAAWSTDSQKGCGSDARRCLFVRL
jgi:hypothetical protein